MLENNYLYLTLNKWFDEELETNINLMLIYLIVSDKILLFINSLPVKNPNNSVVSMKYSDNCRTEMDSLLLLFVCIQSINCLTQFSSLRLIITFAVLVVDFVFTLKIFFNKDEQ